MLLRPYQEVAINDAADALDKHGNTLVVAPTGAGKTIMLSALVGKRRGVSKDVLDEIKAVTDRVATAMLLKKAIEPLEMIIHDFAVEMLKAACASHLKRLGGSPSSLRSGLNIPKRGKPCLARQGRAPFA